MFLEKIRYNQFIDEPRKWELTEVDLGRINLLVGKNSSGKTKTIAIINSLSVLLSEYVKLPFIEGDYNVTFDLNGVKYTYELEYKNLQVIKERLTRNGELLIHRDPDGGGYSITTHNQKLEFKIPLDELKINRRDEIQYPYLEDFNFWARHVRRFEFSSPMGKNALGFRDKVNKNEIDFNLKATEKLIDAFNRGKRNHGDAFLNRIIEDFNSIGFNITSLDLGAPLSVTFHVDNPSVEIVGLRIQEKDLPCMTDQNDMSTGMYRALSTIIHFNFYELERIPGCILIDDIGEGLDFERATKLIQLLIKKAEENNNVQLIMSTNDRFVMNYVDLKYWQIIDRVASTVKYYNIRNSSKTFEDFKFTGLNNFDFFASGFFKNGFIE